MEQLVSQLTDFNEMFYLLIFPKSAKKIQDSFNLTRINEFQFALLSYRSQFYYYEFFQTEVVEKIEKILFTFNNYFRKTIFFERS